WLSGPTRIVREISARDLHPMVDVANLPRSAGERTYSLSNTQIKAPHGVEVVQVVPSEFHLSFDVMATRTVKVAPRVVGAVTGVSSEPDTVRIQGPQNRLAAIDQATTDPVNAAGVHGQQSFMTTVYVNDPLVRVLQPSTVRVTVVASGK